MSLGATSLVILGRDDASGVFDVSPEAAQDDEGRPRNLEGPLLGVCSVLLKVFFKLSVENRGPMVDEPEAFIAEHGTFETLEGRISSISAFNDSIA